VTDQDLACVVLAHADPVHVRRLVAVLDPFPVFLHCDANTPDQVYRAMTRELPPRVTLLDRIRCGWARWEVVAAEVEGYRAALAATDAGHVALLTGSDYPLASTATIRAALGEIPGRSVAQFHRLPYSQWGPLGGYPRLWFPHYAYRRHMIRVPVPRRLPGGIAFSGGSQLKVLARHHAQAVVDVYDRRRDLVDFWRRTWVPDETFVGSVLNTPGLVPGWAGQHVDSNWWYIGWNQTRQKSPPWLTVDDLPTLERARRDPADGVPRLFARKFSTDVDTDVLDEIDRSLRLTRVSRVR
jgi:hypothetical protein